MRLSVLCSLLTISSVLPLSLVVGVHAQESVVQVRPVLFDLGPVKLKDLPVKGNSLEPVPASELLGDQGFVKVEVDGKLFELSGKRGDVAIDSMKGCSEIYFYPDKFGCLLPKSNGDRPVMIHFNFKHQLQIGAHERAVLDEKMILCQSEESVNLPAELETIFDDIYYLRSELSSLKGKGFSEKTGLYREDDLINERERVLDSLTQSWKIQIDKHYSDYERGRLRQELAHTQMETAYFGCHVQFKVGLQQCEVDPHTELEVAQSQLQCDQISVQGGALWCDGQRFAFNSSCPLGALNRPTIINSETQRNVFDGPRLKKPSPSLAPEGSQKTSAPRSLEK